MSHTSKGTCREESALVTQGLSTAKGADAHVLR